MFFWNSLAFSMIQRMLAIWSLVPLPFLKPAGASGSSRFTYCWSLAWRILSTRPCLFDHQAKLLLQLGWGVLIHLPRLADIAASGFHLFWLTNSLNGKNFSSLEDCKRRLKQFFVQKISLGKMKLWSCLKNGRRLGNKTVNMKLNKVHSEYKV